MTKVECTVLKKITVKLMSIVIIMMRKVNY